MMNKKIRIWLDDVRPMPSNFNMWCKSYKEVIDIIQFNRIEHISFDHDLGETKTGYDVACKIEKLAYDDMIMPFTWEVHSSNPIGRKNIEMAMKNAEKFWRHLKYM